MLLKTSVNHVKLPTAIEESHAALGAVVDPVGAVVDLLVSIFCSTCLSSALDTTSPRRPESELSDALSSSACGQKPEAHIKQTSTHSTIAYGSIPYAYHEFHGIQHKIKGWYRKRAISETYKYLGTAAVAELHKYDNKI